jgi:hypothetical protein
MANIQTVDPNDVEGRKFSPVLLIGGIDQETSKFGVNPGTLQDALNYTASTKGYTRAQGLFYFDGTIDAAVTNMWMVGTDHTDSTLYGAGFTLGGVVSWGDNSTGKVVYWNSVAGSANYYQLGIVEILGDPPAAGHTFLDAETGSYLVLQPTVTYDPSELVLSRDPDTGAYIADTVTKYLAFLNDTVNDALVSSVTKSGGYYHGDVPGVGPITGGWQFENEVYAVRDAFCLDFDNGNIQPIAGDTVEIDLDSGSVNAKIAHIEQTGGYWADGDAEGYIVFMPADDVTELYTRLENIDTGGTGYVKDLTATNLVHITGDSTQYGGLVWKATINGWTFVDTGWTLDFNLGHNAPNVKASPLFTEDLVTASRSTGQQDFDAITTQGAAPYIVWLNPSNALADTAHSHATCALASGESSQYLECQLDGGDLPQDDLRVIGIKVTVKAQVSAGNAYDINARLVNKATGSSFYLSANRAHFELLTGLDADYVYGSSSDTWGVEDISAEDIRNGNVYFIVQYTNTATPAAAADVEVEHCHIDITYVPKTEKVWFNDGVGDVCVGVITAFQIDDTGTWLADTAAGNMSFVSLRDPATPADTAAQAVGVDMVMWSEPSGAGVEVATVTTHPTYNLLPSADALEAAGSQYDTIKANYYESDESEAIYGVTGAGRAFTFDGESFAFIRVPIDKSIDKPRHIAFHDNKLALGYESGHVVVSSIGVPNDMSGVTGAGSWGVGDRVTGLISMPGNVMGVFSEASIRTLEGANEADGTMRVLSYRTGCREYTLQNIEQAYYADNMGVGSMRTSDRFGDFDMGRLTDAVRTWVQARLQDKRTTEVLDIGPVTSVAVRNKNEYRLYFADGYILVLYFRANGRIEPTLMHYDPTGLSTDYVPTFIDSTVLSTGRERIVMGTADGKMWVVDGANCIQSPDGVETPDCWFVTNPINFGRPEAVHKHYHVVLQGQFYGAQSVDTWADSNYLFDVTGSAHDSITFGSYSNTPLFSSISEVDSTYLPTLTDGYSMKVQSTMDGSKPHAFQSLLFRATPKGVDRTSAPKAY